MARFRSLLPAFGVGLATGAVLTLLLGGAGSTPTLGSPGGSSGVSASAYGAAERAAAASRSDGGRFAPAAYDSPAAQAQVCGAACKAMLSALTRDRRELTEDEALAFTDNSATLAQALADDPAGLAAFEQRFITETNPDRLDVYLHIAEQLPGEAGFELAETLSRAPVASARLSGLNLMGRLSAYYTPQGQTQLNQIIGQESDPGVLSTALDIARSMPPEDMDPLTRANVVQMMQTHSDAGVRAASLSMLIYHGGQDSQLQSAILSDLSVPDAEVQATQLENLEQLFMARDDQTDYRVVPELEQRVRAIANDTTAPIVARIQAMELMDNYIGTGS